VWGCLDGDHTAWMIVDVDTRQEARAIDALMLQHRQHPA